MNEDEIKNKYKTIHDEMSAEFYPLKRVGVIDDELQDIFDIAHRQNWIDMDAQLIAEGYRHSPEPIRDLTTELDELKAKIEKLEKK